MKPTVERGERNETQGRNVGRGGHDREWGRGCSGRVGSLYVNTGVSAEPERLLGQLNKPSNFAAAWASGPQRALPPINGELVRRREKGNR